MLLEKWLPKRRIAKGLCVRENGARTSQREREICSKQFSLSRHRSMQSREDEVEINLTGNAYVEFRHELGSRCCRDGGGFPFDRSVQKRCVGDVSFTRIQCQQKKLIITQSALLLVSFIERYHGIEPLRDDEHPQLGRARYNLTFRKAA